MAWLDCRLKEGPGQCRDDTWCWTGTVYRTARRPYLSHYITSVTGPHNNVWLYRCKLGKIRPPELCQIPPETHFSPSYRAQFISIRKKNWHIYLYWRNKYLLYQSQGIQIGVQNYKIVLLLRPRNTNSSVLIFQRLKLGWNQFKYPIRTAQ